MYKYSKKKNSSQLCVLFYFKIHNFLLLFVLILLQIETMACKKRMPQVFFYSADFVNSNLDYLKALSKTFCLTFAHYSRITQPKELFSVRVPVVVTQFVK